MILRSIGHFVAAEDVTQTHHAIWPEGYELLFGIPASLLVFGMLWKLAGPAIKKGMAARTAKIQGELDAGESARSNAEVEAAKIREAKGDIASERSRILAGADQQAEAILLVGISGLTPCGCLEYSQDAGSASRATALMLRRNMLRLRLLFTRRPDPLTHERTCPHLPR